MTPSAKEGRKAATATGPPLQSGVGGGGVLSVVSWCEGENAIIVLFGSPTLICLSWSPIRPIVNKHATPPDPTSRVLFAGTRQSATVAGAFPLYKRGVAGAPSSSTQLSACRIHHPGKTENTQDHALSSPSLTHQLLSRASSPTPHHVRLYQFRSRFRRASVPLRSQNHPGDRHVSQESRWRSVH